MSLSEFRKRHPRLYKQAVGRGIDAAIKVISDNPERYGYTYSFAALNRVRSAQAAA